MKTTFQGKLGHNKISFRMISKNNEIEVLVENIQTFERYQAIIDQSFIQNSGRLFQETFSSLQDLFNFLTQNFQEIQILEGSMTFVYGVINKIPKKVSLQLRKEEVDSVEQARLKIDKIQQEIIRKRNNHYRGWMLIIFLIALAALAYSYHQNRIQQFEQRIEELAGNLRQYQQNYTYVLYSEHLKWQNMKVSMQKSLKEQRKLRQKFRKDLEYYNNSYSQLLNKTLSTQQSFDFRLSKLQGNLTKIDRLGHHPNNSHKEHFIITHLSANSIQLSKKSSGFYNFVNKEELTANKQTKYTVKLVKKISSSVTIGFTTQKGFGVIDNYGSSESVYYDTKRSGFIWIEGKSKELFSVGTIEGDIVECIADLAKGKFSWWKAGTKIQECDIPPSMQRKPLYFSLQFPNIEDILEISV